MGRFARVALVATLLLSGCGNDGIPSAQNYAVVYGRVYDAATNAAVAGVVVSVDVVDTATTGADGTYSVINVPIGQTDVTVSVPTGYVVASPGALVFSVNPGDRYRLDIALNHQ
jgi:hypothetical protein